MDVLNATTSSSKHSTLLDPAAKLNQKKQGSPSGWDAALNKAKPGQGLGNLDADSSKRLAILGAMNGPQSLNAAKGIQRPSASTFAETLNEEAAKRDTDEPKPANEAALHKTAETLVGQFFMGSMLKQMRDSPFKNEMFSGGKGGAAYEGLFDQRIAEHSGGRIAKGLVNSMVKQYEKNASGPKGLYAVPEQNPKTNAATKAGRVKHDTGKSGIAGSTVAVTA